MTDRYQTRRSRSGLLIMAVAVLAIVGLSSTDLRAAASGSKFTVQDEWSTNLSEVQGTYSNQKVVSGPYLLFVAGRGGGGTGFVSDGASGAMNSGMDMGATGGIGKNPMPQGDRDMGSQGLEGEVANPDLDRADARGFNRNRTADSNHDMMGEHDINRDRNTESPGMQSNMGPAGSSDLGRDRDTGEARTNANVGANEDVGSTADQGAERKEQDLGAGRQEKDADQHSDLDRGTTQGMDQAAKPDTPAETGKEKERGGFFDWLFNRK